MKVPTYEKRTAGPPISLTAPRARFDTSSVAVNPTGSALPRAGDIIAHRAQQMQDEIDSADVVSAFSRYRDESREITGALYAKQGRDARGAGKAYQEWFDKTSSNFIGELANDRQKAKFQALIQSHRGHNLDSLSRHEANQHQAYKASVASAMVSDTINETTLNPWSDEARETAIDMAMSSINSVNPGLDMGAQRNQAESQIRTATLQSMIDQDPERAAPYLEKWKDEIGAQTYVTLKGRAEKQLDKNKVTVAHRTIREYFNMDGGGFDYAGAEEFLADPKNMEDLEINLSQQQQLLNVLQAEEASDINRERRELAETQKQAGEDIYQAAIAGDVKTALDILDDSPLDAGTKMTWRTALTKPAVSTTDVEVRSGVLADILSGKITQDYQIMAFEGHGLTSKDVALAKEFRKAVQEDPDKKTYISKSLDYFDAQFDEKEFPDIVAYKPDFEVWLHKEILEKKLKGPEIYEAAKGYVGNLHDIEEPWFGDDKLHSPFGEYIDKTQAAQMKSADEKIDGKSPSTAQKASKGGIAEEIDTTIPPDIKGKIIESLEAGGHAVTDGNIKAVYEKYYAK